MNNLDNQGIGRRLKEFRAKAGMSMVEIIIDLSTSMSQYSRLESGKISISVSTLRKVCEMYHCSANYILFGKEKNRKNILCRKLDGLKEATKRHTLKVLTCLLEEDGMEEQYGENPVYKLFYRGLLEMIPIDAKAAIPYVLKFERKFWWDAEQGIHIEISENEMIRQMNLTRFRWNVIMSESGTDDIRVPLRLHELFGYDMDFLVNNRLPDTGFFDECLHRKSIKYQDAVMAMFEKTVCIEEELRPYEGRGSSL